MLVSQKHFLLYNNKLLKTKAGEFNPLYYLVVAFPHKLLKK